MNKIYFLVLFLFTFNAVSVTNSYENEYLKIDFRTEKMKLEDDVIKVDVFITPLRNYNFFGVSMETDGVILSGKSDVPNKIYKNVFAGDTKKFKLNVFLNNEDINKIKIKTILVDENKKLKRSYSEFYIPKSKRGFVNGERKETYPPRWTLD